MSKLLNLLTKAAKPKRPDIMMEMNNALLSMSKHPQAASANLIMPYSVWRNPEIIDKLKLTDKQSVKLGFLLKCAEAKKSLEEIEALLDKQLEKKALVEDPIATGGRLLGHGAGAAATGAGSLANLGWTTLVGLPVLGGGLLGYAAGKFLDRPDIDAIKAHDVRNEYLRLANEANRRAVIKKMQSKEPGTVVRVV